MIPPMILVLRPKPSGATILLILFLYSQIKKKNFVYVICYNLAAGLGWQSILLTGS